MYSCRQTINGLFTSQVALHVTLPVLFYLVKDKVHVFSDFVLTSAQFVVPAWEVDKHGNLTCFNGKNLYCVLLVPRSVLRTILSRNCFVYLFKV